MNLESIGSSLLNQWLHAQAAASHAGDLISDGRVKTADDVLQEMERHCLSFCRVAVEEYNLSLAAPLRTVHPNRLLLQQGMKGRGLSFAKDRAELLRDRFRVQGWRDMMCSLFE